ncbi:MAG: DegV family protein [Clostridia bacterium]|nr:DegV family protein [Clostridia bacterium]
MATVAVVTDTNSGILPAQAKKLGVYTVSMPFYIDGKLYMEGEDLTPEEFYKFQEADADIKTSMPSVGVVTALWEELLQTYDEVVYIPMSSGLSSSCRTATAMAEEDFPGKVFVVDNQRISVLQRHTVLEAKAMADAGFTGEQIRAKLEETKLDADIYIAVDTLKYLRRGGRVTPAAAALGTVLNIKPVLRIKGEKLDAHTKVRGKIAAKQAMMRALKEAIANDPRLYSLDKEGRLAVGVAYTGNREEAEARAKEMKAEFPGHLFYMDELALSVACHVGRGALGVGCYIDMTKDFKK